MIFTFVGIINEIIMVYAVPVLEVHPIVKEIVAKMFLIITEIWVFLLCLYTVTVSNIDDKGDSGKTSTINYVLFGILLVFSIITCILPIKYAYNANKTSWLYTYGPSVQMVFLTAVVYISISIVSIF